MVKILIALSFTLLTAVTSHAAIRVAFFEYRGWGGKHLSLEKNGRFAHVAIEVENGWLHASPISGVEWLPDLASIGKVSEVLSHRGHGVTKKSVTSFLHQAYDFSFSWNGEGQYCSKLVAQILKIAPRPMVFDSAIWPASFRSRRGELGLSPDEVFAELLKRGFQADFAPSKTQPDSRCKVKLQEI